MDIFLYVIVVKGLNLNFTGVRRSSSKYGNAKSYIPSYEWQGLAFLETYKEELTEKQMDPACVSRTLSK